MTTTSVALRQHDDVLEVVLDRPDRRNALSRSLLVELRRTFTNLPEHVRAVVLSSSGPAFTAGADFADLTGTSADLQYDEDLDGACSAVRDCGVPVIAAVDGACVGAGVELATSCEARIVGPHAWFRVPAVELGLLYNPTSIRRLHATLPRTTVTRMLVFAATFDADEAVNGGLATHGPDPDPRELALTLAHTLARLPQGALAATRELLRNLDAGNWNENEWQSTRTNLLNSSDRHDAIAAANRRHGVSAPQPPTH